MTRRLAPVLGIAVVLVAISGCLAPAEPREEVPGTPPAYMTVDATGQGTTGQSVPFTIHVRSSSGSPLPNVTVTVEHPNEVTPAWAHHHLPSLAPGAQITLEQAVTASTPGSFVLDVRMKICREDPGEVLFIVGGGALVHVHVEDDRVSLSTSERDVADRVVQPCKD